ncbi:FRG1-like family-domain-containing protein [Lineolata rhizophorae]|uniref:FRG1-like family-domain-containing protein n=1 Tax=Lineolata rhizophorae TaxID=578093 RepID=A0A6A6P301_9PEZI|nr:FRG1-like family-domain-containing protein [Lineolata rhizophorae]
MVKALTFKGDKKPKKRKRTEAIRDPFAEDDAPQASPSAVTVATTSASVTAAAPPAPDDDSWVGVDAPTDVSGPVLIVLATRPDVSALACDATGAVFALPVENMVEGDPRSAEPHDVRQVWIANRVAGTEGWMLKGHHGKYLSCDKYGILGATKEAVGTNESFVVEEAPAEARLETGSGAQLLLRTAEGKYVSVDADKPKNAGIRGDTETPAENCVVRIRMQARFKPKLKVAKVEKAREKISRKQLEQEAGRRLEDDEVRRLKKARKEGDYHEAMLDIKVKGKHDKFA